MPSWRETRAISRVLRVLATVVLAGVVGCSAETSPRTPACNRLINDGPLVTATAVSTMPPAAAGGTIVDGTYELTATTLYLNADRQASPPPGTFSGVVEMAGNAMQQVFKINGSEWHYTASFTVTGVSISLLYTCPNAATESHSLTATADEFRIYDTDTDGTLEQVYRKR